MKHQYIPYAVTYYQTRLLGESEKLKKRMSSYAGAMPLSIECFMNDVDVAGKLSRDDMISSAKDLLVRAEATMKQILVNAKLSKADIDGVEIVGGSTRIPAIKGERISPFIYALHPVHITMYLRFCNRYNLITLFH